MTDLPLHGVPDTRLGEEPEEARRALADTLAGEPAELGARLRAVAAAHPAFLDAWARLAAWALDGGDPVAAYAFARTGYHRGLDRIRKAGWRGKGAVPWVHEANRGFLRSLHALLRAAAAIGEDEEAARCRAFLLALDPADPFAVARAGPGEEPGPTPA
jgi:Protein of unknown function (DUF3151)